MKIRLTLLSMVLVAASGASRAATYDLVMNGDSTPSYVYQAQSGGELYTFTDFDLTGSYAINDHVSITGSIMNAFNREAPLDQADYAGAGANYNPTYAQQGLVGRFYNLGVKIKM